jgi:hypothetical protein
MICAEVSFAHYSGREVGCAEDFLSPASSPIKKEDDDNKQDHDSSTTCSGSHMSEGQYNLQAVYQKLLISDKRASSIHTSTSQTDASFQTESRQQATMTSRLLASPPAGSGTTSASGCTEESDSPYHDQGHAEGGSREQDDAVQVGKPTEAAGTADPSAVSNSHHPSFTPAYYPEAAASTVGDSTSPPSTTSNTSSPSSRRPANAVKMQHPALIAVVLPTLPPAAPASEVAATSASSSHPTPPSAYNSTGSPSGLLSVNAICTVTSNSNTTMLWTEGWEPPQYKAHSPSKTVSSVTQGMAGRKSEEVGGPSKPGQADDFSSRQDYDHIVGNLTPSKRFSTPASSIVTTASYASAYSKAPTA